MIRPISGLIAESFCGLPLPGKLAVAFLGVRGMGSIYYLSYGQNNAAFGQLDVLWATTSFAILLSILVHGVFAGPAVGFVEKRRAHIHVGEEDSMASLVPPDHEDREELHAELKEAEAEQMRAEEKDQADSGGRRDPHEP